MIEVPLFWLMDRIKYRLNRKAEVTWGTVVLDQWFWGWFYAHPELKRFESWAKRILRSEIDNRFA